MSGSFEAYCTELGMRCDCVDIEYNPDHDLLCQDFWNKLFEEMPTYDAYLLSPPCSTFTMARTGKGNGPAPLRGTQGRDRYGLKHLVGEEKTKVRQGTLLARRAHATAAQANRAGKPWIFEQPHWRENGTSMFMLDELVQLANEDGVAFHTMDQCEFGSEFEKKTDLLSNVDDDIMAPLRATCSHEKTRWVVPWSGEETFSSHPPLRGRQKAIPFCNWNKSMLQPYEPRGEFLTRATAAYPDDMNKQLAKCIFNACERHAAQMCLSGFSVDKQQREDAQEVGGEPPAVNMSEPLTGEVAVEMVSENNGLRNIHKWISPRMKYIGKQIQNLILQWLDMHPEVQQQIMNCLGKQFEFAEQTKLKLEELRRQVRDLLVRNRYPDMSPTCTTDEVTGDTYNTVIRGELLHYWACCVDDPGASVARWICEGAPAGLMCSTEDLDGVFPVADNTREGDYTDLATDYETFENYSGVEENAEAFEAIESYWKKGYLAKFGSLQELEQFVGSKPILSKIGCIVKQKTNHVTGITTTKTRIILDCKRSQVSRAADRTHKSVLPRVSDAIQSTLSMSGDLQAGEELWFLVADIVDAFWLVPLRKLERRFFCARLRNSFYCFLRTAQGSRAAPLSFAAIIALASRWVQSVVSTPLHLGMRTEEARVQTYVDDPLFTIRGDRQRVQKLATVIMIAWTIMGFPLAFHKATLATKLTWIGVELSINELGVEAVVPEEKVAELIGIIKQMLQSNVIAKKQMRTLIGKAMSIASVLFCWRPFLQELYTALYAEDTHAPRECIWTKQVKHTLIWLLTFLNDEMAGIRRQYVLRNIAGCEARVTITWDASPYGMGGTLQLNGVFVEYFAIDIGSEDQQILETASGSHEGQQIWEALAGLVSLRLWSKHWYGSRATLQIRSDNVGALTMLTKLKGGSKQLSLIAREYSLDLGKAQWRPDIVTHIPGLSNVICDALSRKFDRKKPYQLPQALMAATEVTPPARDLSWWKTLTYERNM